MSTTPLWLVAVDLPTYAPLAVDAETDVCVVGAGVAGLTTAYLLAKAGRRVLVLEAGGIAEGQSARTTAHLTTAFDDRYMAVARAHGEDGARRVADSQAAAINRIEALVREEALDCGFARVDGWLVAGPEHDAAYLDREAEASRAAGLVDVRLVRGTSIPGYADAAAVHYPRQARLHVPRYLAGLARAIERLGGRLHGGTRVTGIDDGASATVRTTGGATVRASAVVVATNSPISDRVAVHTKQAPYRSYVVGLQVPRGAFPDVLLWTTGETYEYVRLVSGEEAGLGDDVDVVLVGGADHKTGEAGDEAERFARLERWTREHFPGVPFGPVVSRWSGQVQEPSDFLGFAGRDPAHGEHVYLITGDSGQGITNGTLGALTVADQIQGRPPRWDGLYDPARKPVGSLETLKEFAREGLDVAARFVGDRVTAPRVNDATERTDPAPGDGLVVRRGAQLVARYRDREGRLHERDARCTHLGCPVHWNGVEEQWVCPCHGSHFAPTGQVVQGPAAADLGAVE